MATTKYEVAIVKIGINAWVWVSPFSSERDLGLIGKVRTLGGQTFEFAIEDDSVIDSPAVRRTLEDEGLGCSIVGTFGPAFDLSSEDPAVRRLGIDHARRCLDTSAMVGASLFTGATVGAGGTDLLSEPTRQARLGYAADGLREVGEHAAEVGLPFAIEVLNRYENNLLNTALQARQLIDLVDHPSVGIHLDSFHMSLEESNLGDAIRIAGDRLIHFHGSESHRGTPGGGLVPWDDVSAALSEINYDRYIVIESFNPSGRRAPRVRIWRPLAESQDALAKEGLAFLRASLLG